MHQHVGNWRGNLRATFLAILIAHAVTSHYMHIYSTSYWNVYPLSMSTINNIIHLESMNISFPTCLEISQRVIDEEWGKAITTTFRASCTHASLGCI